MDQPLPKTEPIHNCGGPSLLTCWRKDKREWAAAVKEMNERSNPADTKVSEEGDGMRERFGGQLAAKSQLTPMTFTGQQSANYPLGVWRFFASAV